MGAEGAPPRLWLVPRGHPQGPRVPGSSTCPGVAGGGCCIPLGPSTCRGDTAWSSLGRGSWGSSSAQGGTGGCAAAVWHEVLPRCVLGCPSLHVFSQRFGGLPGQVSSTSPPPPRAGGMGRAVFSHAGSGQPWAAPGSPGQPQTAPGSPGQPCGVTAGAPCRGKCVAATTPACSGGTLRHREAAKFTCPLCWHPWAGLLGHGEPLGTAGLPWQGMAGP